jgi:hypothetical protein
MHSSKTTSSASFAPPPRDYARGRDPLRIGRTPLHFFVVALIFFVGGMIALPFVVPAVAAFFYQPGPLALTHTFTLGWITAAVIGVMYRYVPALTRRAVPYPRLALAQVALYAIGVSGMIAHFTIGIWSGVWLAAIVVVLSIVIFAANMFPCLWPQAGRGVAETGMFLALCFLILAASLGFTLAFDKDYDFLRGDVLTNLGSHVHFAAVGWVTLTICAVSYRMLPAFLLPRATLPPRALWQIYALTIAVLGLGFTLLFRLEGAPLWALLIVASLLAYIVMIARLVRTRRMPFDWTTRHALAGIGWLAIAGMLGVMLSITGAQSDVGNRLAGAYGFAGLLGFISNFIIGMSYKLFPGFVARARAGSGWPAVTNAELSEARPQPIVFATFNGGLAIIVVGLLAGWVRAAVAGGIAIALGGITYAIVTLWTLSYAYRSAIPRAARTELRVLPE